MASIHEIKNGRESCDTAPLIYRAGFIHKKERVLCFAHSSKYFSYRDRLILFCIIVKHFFSLNTGQSWSQSHPFFHGSSSRKIGRLRLHNTASENHFLSHFLVSYVPFSCLLSQVPCLTFPVSRLKSSVSCLTSSVSCLTPQVFCLLSHIFCLLSHISCLTVLSLLSHVFCPYLTYPV